MKFGSYFVLFCVCSTMFYASSNSSSSSSDGTDHYRAPVCAPDGFFCPTDGQQYDCDTLSPPYPCEDREDRCTGEDDAEPECKRKSFDGCNYDSEKGVFRVCRHWTPLQSSGRRRRESGSFSLACLKRRHEFITYRGLMYEFGKYGEDGSGGNVRVQDPNDPCYEYNTRSSQYTCRKDGVSNCTYDQVKPYLSRWDPEYNLCINNCQHFAKGLEKFLIDGCPDLTQNGRGKRSEDAMLEYIISISTDENCTVYNQSDTPTPSPTPDSSDSPSTPPPPPLSSSSSPTSSSSSSSPSSSSSSSSSSPPPPSHPPRPPHPQRRPPVGCGK